MQINFLTAFDTNKNIGGAYNRMIERINDEWIFIKDGDCMFLRPDYGNQIADVIAMHGNKYDVLGCLANRLAGQHQRVGELSDKADINHHRAIASIQYNNFYSEVKETTINVAAMMMCFKRSLWEKVGGFTENSIRFDIEFCERAKQSGAKLGIMQGLYMFHLYRWGSDNPMYDIKHLQG